MTRIISGSAGGRRLAVPRGDGTRPTTDRVRESTFARLESLGAVAGARVLDLYAGSGALGLEALSRGAASAVLVESDAAVAAVARSNAGALGLGPVRVVVDRAERWPAGAARRGDAFDLVLCDPPYALGDEALGALLAAVARVLAPGGVVAVERSTRSPEPAWPGGWEALGSRGGGESAVWLARG